MITAIVIPADVSKDISRVELDPTNVEGYQALVGGWLERVELHDPEASMYLNEEGKINNLELNRRASALLWVQNTAFAGRDVIVGDAFIVGPANRAGNDTTAPDELQTLLFDTKTYGIEVRVHGESRWAGNAARYTDPFDACVAALDLAHRWTLVEHMRIVAAD